MGYKQNLIKACEWLSLHQNEDRGWGLTAKQGSSLVNTSEAIYVLTRQDRFKYSKQIQLGLKFLEEKIYIVEDHPRTRYICFPLLAFIDYQDTVGNNSIDYCVLWLLDARNTDDGWGHEANDNNSKLFPTCLALLVLEQFLTDKDILVSSYNWVKSNKKEFGWAFDDKVSATATAIAVLALKEDENSTYTRQALEILLTNSHWNVDIENVPGTPWGHCSYQWIFPALIKLGVEPYSSTIAEGVRVVNKLSNDNGWLEPNGALTVRGQFWAVFALHALQIGFDPSIHTYKIDSSIAKDTLKEPEFVNILIRTKFATVIPLRIYAMIIYILFSISMIVFFGIHRSISVPQNYLDVTVSVSCFALAYFLLEKRKKYFDTKFGRSFKIVFKLAGGLIALLGAAHLIFGISVAEIFEYLRQFIHHGTHV